MALSLAVAPPLHSPRVYVDYTPSRFTVSRVRGGRFLEAARSRSCIRAHSVFEWEIQANHVLVYLPSTLLCEITTKQNKTLTHTDTLRFMYMGYIGAHVHETYVYIWNMYTYSNTSFRYLIVDIRHETWRCGTLHIDLSTCIV